MDKLALVHGFVIEHLVHGMGAQDQEGQVDVSANLQVIVVSSVHSNVHLENNV